ncbi:hypothetical protein K493DRAFT_342419 [Basidiobolus meristosporus CBS 931.73]|uniref:Tag1-like fifth Ig-like domain-containing protein n=1 Tax=Basidiobolus meristosporus CBS 931.73 TaxID=1314790 RepID=A0A1Y1X6F1_9FUNG|nr:hypothetical protein K493DRAFT_342419 [Basidiobolus meristosporus CBS 931.73]|eukprot:ORX81255.1 hypothetical protein K493DRAFT_342419 [Basidiobolus meristosporus CBS 931.73]
MTSQYSALAQDEQENPDPVVGDTTSRHRNTERTPLLQGESVRDHSNRAQKVGPATTTTQENVSSESNVHSYQIAFHTLTTRWKDLQPQYRWLIIAGIILLSQVLLGLVVVYGVVPWVAQRALNHSKIVFLSTNITQPKPDSFMMEVSAILENVGRIPATSQPTSVDIYYKEQHIGRADMPGMLISSDSGPFEIATKFVALDRTALGVFAADMVALPKITWTMKGNVDVVAKGLHVRGLKLDKEVTLEGLNGAKNITLNSFDLPGNDPTGGIHLEASSTLFNPSNISLEVGVMRMGIFYQGVKMANVTAEDVRLYPGENTLNLSGSMLPLDKKASAVASKFFSRYLSGEESIITVGGLENSSPIPWLDRAFQSLRVDVPFRAPVAPDLIEGLDVGQLAIHFTKSNAYMPSTNGSVVAAVKMPFDFPIAIESLGQTTQLCMATFGADDWCIPFAELQVPLLPVTTTTEAGLIYVNSTFDSVPLKVLEYQEDMFRYFIMATFFNQENILGFTGNVETTAKAAIGELDLKDIKFTKYVKLKGLAGFHDPAPVLTGMEILKDIDKVTFAADIILFNPTNFSAKMGDVSFDLEYKDTVIGEAFIPNFMIVPGNNSVSCKGKLRKETDDYLQQKIEEFLSNYVSGSDNALTIVGNDASTDIDSLKPMLKSFRTTFNVPGSHDQLMDEATMHLLSRTAVVKLFNPLKYTDINIKYLNATSFYEGLPVGHVFANFTEPQWNNQSILIPAGGEIYSPKLPVSLESGGLKLIKKALSNGGLALDMVARSLVEINGVEMWLTYVNSKVPIKVVGWFL